MSKISTTKWRYISSLILIFLFIPALFIASCCDTPGRWISAFLFASIAMLGMFEILNSFGFNKIVSFTSTISILLFFIFPYDAFLNIVEGKWDMKMSSRIAVGLSWQNYLISSLFIILPLFTQPDVIIKKDNSIMRIILLFLVFIIVPTFSKVLWSISIKDLLPLLYFMPIAIVHDSFGYLGGKFFGKYFFKGKKLSPKISPNKTWGGFIIGFTLAVIYAGIVGYYLNVWSDFNNEILIDVIMAFTLSLCATFGDLLFSYIKRVINVKDFSNLIPGHGGVFDRLDSISLIMFVSGMTYLFL